jgi:hypothetical protein
MEELIMKIVVPVVLSLLATVIAVAVTRFFAREGRIEISGPSPTLPEPV